MLSVHLSCICDTEVMFINTVINGSIAAVRNWGLQVTTEPNDEDDNELGLVVFNILTYVFQPRDFTTWVLKL